MAILKKAAEKNNKEVRIEKFLNRKDMDERSISGGIYPEFSDAGLEAIRKLLHSKHKKKIH